MDVTWLDPANLRTRDVAGVVAVLEAVRVADYLHVPAATTPLFVADLHLGWDGDPRVAAMARDDTGAVMGVVQVELPRWDNTHMAYFDVSVHPAHRRRGLGTRLFDAAVEVARADGRTLVLAGCFDDTPGPAFCKSLGLDRACDDVQRRQDLEGLDWAELDRRLARARPLAADYDLTPMPGAVPEHLVAGVALMAEAINDAPRDDLALQDDVYTPARIRAFETSQEAHRRRVDRLVATDRRSGDLAGHTLVSVDAERPWLAEQYDTSVLHAHRGHRLGLVLKIEMLRWLREEEPQLLTIDTWNAASNDHVVAVNLELGYRVIARASEWQRTLVR